VCLWKVVCCLRVTEGLPAATTLREAEHERELNFIDPSTESRVMISTRVRGLLTNSACVEVSTPSEENAISIVMAAAGMPAGARPPAAASEIARQCGHLPLALGMAGACEIR
jgi:hypothetical protein